MDSNSPDFTIEQGTSFLQNLSFLDSGNPVDITGYHIYFGVKYNPYDTTYVIYADTSSGITLTDPTNGLAIINVNYENTKNVQFFGGLNYVDCFYDMLFKDTNNNVVSFKSGIFRITRAITVIP